MTSRFILVLFLSVFIVLLFPDSNYDDTIIVNTLYGKVRGVSLESARVFFGVPYAAPPIGEYRWKPPQRHVGWFSDIYNATEDPPGCPQYCVSYISRSCPNKTSEDCLSLTIFTPLSATPTSMFAVMVYIHGGAFIVRSGYTLIQDGRYIANHTNTITVFINFRQGALGCLAAEEYGGTPNGNLGILDQRFALEWVRDNIVNFGGDPNRVTLVGHSSGAQAVAIHLTTSKSKHLFHRGIMQSVPITLNMTSKEEAESQAQIFMTLLGCENESLECARKKSVQQILDAQNAIPVKPGLLDYSQPWGPYLDGNDIVKQYSQSFLDDDYHNKSIIVGITPHDVRDSLYRTFPQPMDNKQFIELVSTLLVRNSTDVSAMFRPLDNDDHRDAASYLLLLYAYACSMHYVSHHLSLANISVWNYVFDHPFSFDGWSPELPYCANYPCHGVELPFLFHSIPLIGLSFSDDEEILADSLIHYWANFIHTGDPNINDDTLSKQDEFKNDVLYWPRHKESPPKYIKFMTPENQIRENNLDIECGLLNILNTHINEFE